jgi:carbonic anhydrase/acetyltransferase-like protein (isoleucine patch superfamily)
MIYALAEQRPVIAPDAWVAPNATIIGDVHLGAGSSVWYGATIRGDVFHIRIGAGTNIQDHSVIHVTTGTHPTLVGDGVTVGHGVTLHGCSVGDRALVGIGAIVLDAAVIGEEAMVGAGALVTPGTVIPPRMLAVGSPARVKRPLTDAELDHLRASGAAYAMLAAHHRMSLVAL